MNVRFLVRKFPSQFKGYWQWLILLVWLSYLRSPFPRPERECWSLPIHKTVPRPNFVDVFKSNFWDTFSSHSPYGPLHVTHFALSCSKLNSHSLEYARRVSYVPNYIEGVLHPVPPGARSLVWASVAASVGSWSMTELCGWETNITTTWLHCVQQSIETFFNVYRSGGGVR